MQLVNRSDKNPPVGSVEKIYRYLENRYLYIDDTRRQAVFLLSEGVCNAARSLDYVNADLVVFIRNIVS